MTQKIIVEDLFESIKVRFDDILHLYIKKAEFIGLQSWMETGKKFCIEFTMRDGVIVTEYDDFEKFKTILKQLDPLLS